VEVVVEIKYEWCGMGGMGTAGMNMNINIMITYIIQNMYGICHHPKTKKYSDTPANMSYQVKVVIITTYKIHTTSSPIGIPLYILE